jgi:antitoxin component of MazEF toxin-antitoxin module
MLDQVGLAAGAPVEISVDGGHLIIRPARRRLALDTLLDQCKPENRPDPLDFGPPSGKEMI